MSLIPRMLFVRDFKYDKVQRTTSRLRRLVRLGRLLIDIETQFCTVNPVSRSITSREVVKVVRSSSRDVVLCTLSYQGVLEISFQV